MGYKEAATIYEQARPSYPDESIQFIKSLCYAPTTIVDLGAGTDKLTRLLSTFGAREIIAIEPVPSMRENLKSISSITQIIDGTTERIPLEDNTVDAILCGQAFHWFANERALTEIHRVLKPNGLLALVWNLFDHTRSHCLQQISELSDSHQPHEVPRYKSMEWKLIFDNQNIFSLLQHRQFMNQQRVTRETVIKRILSISFIALLTPEEKQKLIEKIDRIMDHAEEIRDQHEFDAQYLTDVYWSSVQK